MTIISSIIGLCCTNIMLCIGIICIYRHCIKKDAFICETATKLEQLETLQRQHIQYIERRVNDLDTQIVPMLPTIIENGSVDINYIHHMQRIFRDEQARITFV